MHALLQVLARLAAPAVLLVVALVLVYFGDTLPVSMTWLTRYGTYGVLAAGVGAALVYRSGRVLFACLTLLISFAAQQLLLQQGLLTPAARAIYLALAIFVPLDLALLAVLPERGTLNWRGAAKLAALALEAGIAALAVAVANAGYLEWASRKFLPFGIGALPHAGIVVIVAAVVAALVAAFRSRSATAAGCAGAIVAFVVGAHVPTASFTYAILTMAAVLMVTVGLLYDALRPPFRDPLTGLPDRRALELRMLALPRKFSLATFEIDGFREFTASRGEEMGEHVRKMVAAQIRATVGRGNLYRHDRDEFAAVLPRRGAADALTRLDTLRQYIEGYQIALRGPERLLIGKRRRRPGGWKGAETVSVTISAGVAERSRELAAPAAVLEAAERALERARERGGNSVQR